MAKYRVKVESTVPKLNKPIPNTFKPKKGKKIGIEYDIKS